MMTTTTTTTTTTMVMMMTLMMATMQNDILVSHATSETFQLAAIRTCYAAIAVWIDVTPIANQTIAGYK